MNDLGTLIILFIVLKVTNTVDWSWWIVLIPVFFLIINSIIRVCLKRHEDKKPTILFNL